MKALTEIANSKVTIFSLVFVFVSALALGIAIQNQRLVVLALALAIIPIAVYLIFFQFRVLGLLTVMFIPLSVKMDVGASVVSLPGESLVLVIAVFFLAYSLNRSEINVSKIWRHPITMLIALDLLWSVITGLMGELPIISLKRLLIKGVFIIVFYFFFVGLFKNRKNLVLVWLFYGIGLIIPVMWTLVRHAQHDFSKVVSFVMPLPFYNDHTLYACCIAFLLPVIFLFGFKPKWFGFNRNWSLIFLGIGILFLIGEYFSYSRAAWISVIASAVAGILIVFLRFKPVHFVVLVLVGVVAISYYGRNIYQNIATVDDVSRKENVEEHFRSVMNIQTDASNLERINRWQCALRMFYDKPISGFGPGTYQFVYGKYQISPEMTRISTRHGEKGNAHSEYLMYLSETGLPGLLIFMLLTFLVFARALKIFNSASDPTLKWLTFAILLGLISFLVHGVFNSFLDTDKAAVLFYAAAATVVSIEIFHSSANETDSLPANSNPGKKTDI